MCFTTLSSSGGKSGEGSGNAHERSMPFAQRESGGWPPNAGTNSNASAMTKTKVLMKPLRKIIVPVLPMAGPRLEITITESQAHCPAKEPFQHTIYEFNHGLVSL